MDACLAREILGINSRVSQEEIRQAYKRAARRTHPDVGGDSEAFVCVQQAYELLRTVEVESDSQRLETIIRSVELGLAERIKRREYLDWLKQAKNEQRSYGWASHKFRNKYGEWPKLWWPIDTDDPKSFYIAAKRIARKRRYKSGWPKLAFKEKFGRYPDYD